MKLNQSVQRATAILRAAADRADGETASGLARASGLSTSTALRLIHTWSGRASSRAEATAGTQSASPWLAWDGAPRRAT